ncbi:C40 family peptidase [Bacillus sp. SJS]|uniref:C40 family peptidase n=1 Tax=Bacillus sp. SJS TaxID=1423321 RepID=UPI0006908AC4|nr:C40 family peptidase [Bacillus sp. SJS]KZZ84452.1 hypothetical protein AS29_011410 [Bacillus sp. SJS]
MKMKVIAAIAISSCLAISLPFIKSSAATILQTAKQYMGTSYSSKGNTPAEGFNSAGFVQYVFKKTKGIELPPLSSEQWSFGTEVKRESLQPGDVLFFNDSSGGKLSTTGIYEGNGRMIYSSVSKGVTSVGFQNSNYWNSRYAGAKRITGPLKMASANQVISKGLQYLNVPYTEGGQSPDGFDCSGFTKYVYEKASGIYLPETPEQQWAVGASVARENVQPGDLVFFKDTHRPGISHVGIYAGNNQILNATRIGGANKVTVSYLTNNFLQEKFAGIKRVSGLGIDRSEPVVKNAEELVGTKFAKNGVSPETGFDTSSFVQYVFKKAKGMQLPRYGNQQINLGQEVAEKDLKPGDLVFFQTGSIVPAIYAGKGQVILTSNDGVKVIHYKVSTYWSSKYLKAKRI